MIRRFWRWLKSQVVEDMVHNHDEGEPCNAACMTATEWKHYFRS